MNLKDFSLTASMLRGFVGESSSRDKSIYLYSPGINKTPIPKQILIPVFVILLLVYFSTVFFCRSMRNNVLKNF